jgi:hypothetical protein
MKFGIVFLVAINALINGIEGTENPFIIDFPVKKELTDADYVEVQNLLRAIDLDPLLQQNYVTSAHYTSFDDLKHRCTRGVKQTLIDPEKGLFPMLRLEKIGKGGDRCLVSRISYEPRYMSAVTTIANALEEQGFNGYFMYQIPESYRQRNSIRWRPICI